MTLISHEQLSHLVASYGYVVVAVAIGAESMGIPVPGETILVLAAIYAAGHADTNIWFIFVAAALGAILGDNAGYFLGKQFGYPLLRRFGGRFGMTDSRIKVGQYLFLRHGVLVVFLGRFVGLLRILAAFLAGVNRMKWPLFLAANAAGGILWAMIFSFGGFYLGKVVFEMQGMLGPIILVAALCAFFGVGLLIWHFEDRLVKKAEEELPGPLT